MAPKSVHHPFRFLLCASAIALLAHAATVRAEEPVSPSQAATEAMWKKFQAAVSVPTVIPTPSPPVAAVAVPSGRDVATVAVSSDGVYQLHFTHEGREQSRMVRLPASFGARVLHEFKPNRAELKIAEGRVFEITLLEIARGEEDYQVRKITINLSGGESASNRVADDCVASLYPSGGSFYALPVLVGQRCGDVVIRAEPPKYASAN